MILSIIAPAICQLSQPPRLAHFHPPYFAFHRYRLPRVMPRRRYKSSGAIPASASFRMAMLCSSLNRLFRTTSPLGPGGPS
jgi:hypothetical protein